MIELYRHFDAEGCLLYVGVSKSVLVRTSQHKRGSDWFDQVVRIDIERFSTLDDAMAAEQHAIETEKPKHNLRHGSRKVSRTTPRPITAQEVTAAPDGKVYIGGGLQLKKRNGRGKWVFRYSLAGKRRDMGLGSYPEVSLSEARLRRNKWALFLRDGIDPIDARKNGVRLGVIQDRR